MVIERPAPPASACIDWTGSISSRDGYGRVGSSMAHRVAYEAAVGPIQAGLQLDHLCRNRRCVNPEHLEPVTRRENILRGVGASAINAAKDRCPQQHRYDSMVNDGIGRQRVCLRCQREAVARYKAKLARPDR